MIKHILLIVICIICFGFISSCSQHDNELSDGIVRIGMSFTDANIILINQFGKGGKYRDTMEAPPNEDYFDYLIDEKGERIVCVTFSPRGEEGKIIDITLHAGSQFGKAYDKSFRVREIDVKNL